MQISHFIKELDASGFQSNWYHLPLLIHGLEHGLVDEASLTSAANLLRREREALSHATSLDPVEPTLPPQVVNAEEDLSRLYGIAYDGLVFLNWRFPETAERYRQFFFQKIPPSIFVQRHEEKSVAQQIRIFSEMLWKEYRWQDLFDRHYWNTVYAGILASLDGETDTLFADANAYFEMLGAGNPEGGILQSSEGYVLATQLPLMSAAILHALKREGVRTMIRTMGTETLVSLLQSEALPISLPTPSYDRLDQAVLLTESRPRHERLIALPLELERIGVRYQERLASTGLFFAHPTRLLPSNAFWGCDFPSITPTHAQLESLLLSQLPADAQILSPEQREASSFVQPPKASESAVAMTATGTNIRTFFHVNLSAGPMATMYDLAIKVGAFNGIEQAHDATLKLSLQEGRIVKASYHLSTIAPLSVEVDAGRMLALRARAQSGFVPKFLGAQVLSKEEAFLPSDSIERKIFFPVTAPPQACFMPPISTGIGGPTSLHMLLHAPKGF